MSAAGSDDRAGWEDNAAWWQQGFTQGVDAEYTEQILPLVARHLEGAGQVLDVGTGEGQVARVVATRGARVVGVDPSWAQLSEARRRGGGVRLARAGAAALPFSAASFDAAVACLVFEHIDDMDAAVAEVARVLAPGGTFLLLLNHPLLQTPGSGWIIDHVISEQYWRVGPYLVESRFEEEVERGVKVTFFHRKLSRYVNALAASGLTLVEMDEPAPPSGFLERAPEYGDARAIPRLLVLRATRGPDAARGPR